MAKDKSEELADRLLQLLDAGLATLKRGDDEGALLALQEAARAADALPQKSTSPMNNKIMEGLADAVAGRIGRLTVWSSEGPAVSVSAPLDGMVEITVRGHRTHISVTDWRQLH